MIDFCPCQDEKPDPCPACGATVEGNDRVRGVCQARRGSRPEPILSWVLVDKNSGQEVSARQPII